MSDEDIIRIPFEITIGDRGSINVSTYMSTPTAGKEKDHYGPYVALVEVPKEVMDEKRRREFRCKVKAAEEKVGIAVKQDDKP